MKNLFVLILFVSSLNLLSSCSKSEIECSKILIDVNEYASAAIATTKKAVADPHYRTGNYSRDIEAYIKKISSLLPEICDRKERNQMKEELECFEDMKLALSTENKFLIDKSTTRLSNLLK